MMNWHHLAVFAVMLATAGGPADDATIRPATDVETRSIVEEIADNFRRVAPKDASICFRTGRWDVSLYRESEHLLSELSLSNSLHGFMKIYGRQSQWPVDDVVISDVSELGRHVVSTDFELPGDILPADYIPEQLRCIPAQVRYDENISIPLVKGDYAVLDNGYGLFFLRRQNGEWKVDTYVTFLAP